MEDITHVSKPALVHADRQVRVAHTPCAREARCADWYPRIPRKDTRLTPQRTQQHAPRHERSVSSALQLPAAASRTRHDLIALRKAREAQAFSAYAHRHSRDQYQRGDHQRAAHWQRLAADATRGAIMYRELGRMLLSAGDA